MSRTLALVCSAFALAGCFPRTAPPPGQLSAAAVASATQRWTDASESSIEQGRHLFVKSCGECHGHPALDAVSEAKWPSTMERMAGKSDLTPADAELLLRFVLTAIEASRPAEQNILP